jgi:hypothetical protein
VTYTVATLPVSASTYDEIERKLLKADYGHVFTRDRGGRSERIDMTHIALVREEEQP